MNSLLTTRPMSGFPLSIASSLAMESIFDPIQPVFDEAREVEKIKDLSIYSLFVINTTTLLRNIIESIKFAEFMTISRKDVYDCLLEEIEFLTNFFAMNNLSVKFYVHTYQYVKDNYEKTDRLRKSSTDKQYYLDGVYKYCLDQLRKEDDVQVFHKNISYSREDSVLLFTHVPFDLLSHSNFMRLDLLESHTGHVKTRKDWWSKYYPVPKEDMSFLPFHEYLLCDIFGDRHMFKPADLAKRNDYIRMLRKRGINPLSSEFSLLRL